ncbi:uncharacterized protein LOC125824856 [Solanum verrucosum]|uniref:uncharacterized protein LOC125824856 n=1 Tax=Solanum verrucosum TaxID=315347 RepID=UPI0020D074AB|nr:uncharacterized protein LOC125824856 [Solanum verrucosum]
MGTACHNLNGKIWLFVEDRFQMKVQMDTEQLLSFKLTYIDDGHEIHVTLVHASTDRHTRIALWDDLYTIATSMTSPWLVGGDFNVIIDDLEKYGGLPVQFNETEDFIHCNNTCQLTNLGFKESMYTWWNGKTDAACLFKRLDRCLGNQALQDLFPNLEVEHLIKQGSDHSPLKRVSKALSKWSKDSYGDIFRQIDTLAEVVQNHEQEFENNPTSTNRERLQTVQADSINLYAVEEKFWKQKAGMQWFVDGIETQNFPRTC